MKITFKSFFIPFVALAMAMSLSACNDDDDDNGGGGGGGGGTGNPVGNTDEISFTVAGDINANKVGSTLVISLSFGQFSSTILSGFDGDQPGSTSSFDLSFVYLGATMPDVGEYPISAAAATSASGGFFVTYTELDSEGEELSSYGVTAGQTGTLNVVSKTEERVTGTFSFTASNLTGSGQITVTNGVFNAEVL